MSNIVKFFVATRAGALGVMNSGVDASFRTASFGNFDVEEALLDWEAHLTGQSFESLVGQGLPLAVADDEAGSAVFLLSDELLAQLLAASSSQIDELAGWWVQEKAANGVEIDRSIALIILQELVDLIRQERGTDEGVYCWTT